MANWPKSKPVRLRFVGSNDRRLAGKVCVQRVASVAVAMMPMPIVITTVARRVHVVERTLRSFVHSDRNTPVGRYRRAEGAGMVVVMRVIVGSLSRRRLPVVVEGDEIVVEIVGQIGRSWSIVDAVLR